MPLLETPVHSQASLSQSLVGSLLLFPGSWCIQGSVYALQESVSPVLCKFWWLYGGVNDDLHKDSLCLTQVCCTQSPCPCSSPLLTRTSTGDIQRRSVSVSQTCKMGTIKDRNGMDLTEAEDINKRWQEHTEDLYTEKI